MRTRFREATGLGLSLLFVLLMILPGMKADALSEAEAYEIIQNWEGEALPDTLFGGGRHPDESNGDPDDLDLNWPLLISYLSWLLGR